MGKRSNRVRDIIYPENLYPDHRKQRLLTEAFSEKKSQKEPVKPIWKTVTFFADNSTPTMQYLNIVAQISFRVNAISGSTVNASIANKDDIVRDLQSLAKDRQGAVSGYTDQFRIRQNLYYRNISEMTNILVRCFSSVYLPQVYHINDVDVMTFTMNARWRTFIRDLLLCYNSSDQEKRDIYKIIDDLLEIGSGLLLSEVNWKRMVEGTYNRLIRKLYRVM